VLDGRRPLLADCSRSTYRIFGYLNDRF